MQRRAGSTAAPTTLPPPPPPSLPPPPLPSPLRSVLSTGARTTSAAHAAWDALVRPGDFAVDATAGNGHDTLKLARLVGASGSVLGLDASRAALASTLARLEEEARRRAACGAAPLGRVDLVLGCHSRLAEAVRERERRRRKEREGQGEGEGGGEGGRLSLWSLGEEKTEEREGASDLSLSPPVALAAFNLGYLPKLDDLDGGFASTGTSKSNAKAEAEAEAEFEAAAAQLLLDERAQLATATKPDTTVLAIEAAARLLAPGGTVSICSYFQHAGGGAEAEAVRRALRPFDPRVWTCVESRVLNRPEAPVLTLCYRSTRPKKGGKGRKGGGSL